jgi:hypothetical protein
LSASLSLSSKLTVPGAEEKIGGGYVVRDANGQTLAHIFARSSESEAIQAKVFIAKTQWIKPKAWESPMVLACLGARGGGKLRICPRVRGRRGDCPIAAMSL